MSKLSLHHLADFVSRLLKLSCSSDTLILVSPNVNLKTFDSATSSSTSCHSVCATVFKTYIIAGLTAIL